MQKIFSIWNDPHFAVPEKESVFGLCKVPSGEEQNDSQLKVVSLPILSCHLSAPHITCMKCKICDSIQKQKLKRGHEMQNFQRCHEMPCLRPDTKK